jgi:hypothetical protein
MTRTTQTLPIETGGRLRTVRTPKGARHGLIGDMRDQVFFRRNCPQKIAISPSLNIAQTISVRQSLSRYRGSLINLGTER